MPVWKYGWTVAPLIAVFALGANLTAMGHRWIGWPLIFVGGFGLLLVLLKEHVERQEKACAFYKVDGQQATYLYSWTEFRRLPKPIQDQLLRDPKVKLWWDTETLRHGEEVPKETVPTRGAVIDVPVAAQRIEAYRTRLGRTWGWMRNKGSAYQPHVEETWRKMRNRAKVWVLDHLI